MFQKINFQFYLYITSFSFVEENNVANITQKNYFFKAVLLLVRFIKKEIFSSDWKIFFAVVLNTGLRNSPDMENDMLCLRKTLEKPEK